MKRRLSERRSKPDKLIRDKGDGGQDAVLAFIETMGSHGDGVAQIGGAKVHIPFALPGETVRALIQGRKAKFLAVETGSPHRVPPICRHFGACGGCAMQHWDDVHYASWKLGLVQEALQRAGIGTPLEHLTCYPLSSRRRATFAVRTVKGGVELGYNAARSHDLVDLGECPILVPKIMSTLPLLRSAFASILTPGSEAKLRINAAANGLDCSIEGPPLRAEAQSLFCRALSPANVIRAVWNGDTILHNAEPYVVCGGVRVPLPPGAFVQAVAACEHDMVAFVEEALAEAGANNGPVCDLFAGLGAFTFPCSRSAPVNAYEENAAAVAAMVSAARDASGRKPITPLRRDLFRNPLGPIEVNKFKAIIVDPPREGAMAQCNALAASKVRTVVMLSCNPATFARDAGLLIAGGFELRKLAAFDQFRYSAHVEVAGAFGR